MFSVVVDLCFSLDPFQRLPFCTPSGWHPQNDQNYQRSRCSGMSIHDIESDELVIEHDKKSREIDLTRAAVIYARLATPRSNPTLDGCSEPPW